MPFTIRIADIVPAFRHYLLHGLWLLTSPLLLLLLPQAIYVKRTTLRLPEADAQNPSSKPEGIQLLHIGESTVAGVGVTSLEQGLTANLATQLESSLHQPVNWHSFGVNGIRLNELINEVEQQTLDQADLVVVTMGVNDTTGLTSVKQWQYQLQRCIDYLKDNHSAPIVFTQVPPMLKFPALPAPLRYFIGIRALIMDGYLQKVCKRNTDTFYVGIEPEFKNSMMAKDGYHPSATGYQAWAQALEPELTEILLNRK